MNSISRSLLMILIMAVLPAVYARSASAATEVKIGSKKFTESVILGEIATGVVRHAGYPALHLRELGGTRVLWSALLHGRIDAYPEYTGTISQEIFNGKIRNGEEDIRRALLEKSVIMLPSLGFNDNYAIGMEKQTCVRLGIRTISDLRRYRDLAFGFSNEFMDREDGWPGLRERYNLPQKKVFGMDHDLAYRGLADGSIDATDVYTTDAEIAYYGLCTLEDDLHYFPLYTAVLLVRADLQKKAPAAFEALVRLSGKINGREMIRMNELAKIEKVPETAVAADFLERKLSIKAREGRITMLDRLGKRTKEHLYLVLVSLSAAIVVSIPLGIIAEKRPGPGRLILAFAGIIQTIPSLALLVFMIPLLGIGGPPAIFALFLYSLLPIIRNTFTGLRGIPPAVRESAEAIGLPSAARLRLVELPLASPDILSGIKTSAVINVGTATLGALIGAGGYGQPILTGIRLDDVVLILEGAVPAALLALLVQGLFELAEKIVVPKGLRLK